MSGIIVQELSVAQGEKQSGWVKVLDTGISLPITIICGKEEGKTVLVTGGIHNAEYLGIQTAIEVAKELDPRFIVGNVIILPLVNRSGFENRTMSVVFEDQKNLNRVFPGTAKGTVAEKISYYIVEEFFERVDFHIDLHCGDGYEELTPYVYCQGKAEEDICQLSKKMAKAVCVPYHVASQTSTGGAYNYAGSCRIPGILLERGGMGTWSMEDVNIYKEDVYNVLRTLTTLKDGKDAVSYKQDTITNVTYENAPYTGCWYPFFQAGERIKKGEVLGVIKDYFGNELSSVYAKHDGVILYQTRSLNVLIDGPVTAYGEIISGI